MMAENKGRFNFGMRVPGFPGQISGNAGYMRYNKTAAEAVQTVNLKGYAEHRRCRHAFFFCFGGQIMKDTRKLTLAAMFLAVGQILPFITGQIPQVGAVLLPMHYPVFLAAFFLGPSYAALIGFICPLLRGVLFGMPVLFPNGIAMAFELCTYGFVPGMVFNRFPEKNLIAVFVSLIIGMLAGRLVWGIAEVILLGIASKGFTMQMFLAGAFINALPGIVLQLVLIPLIVRAFLPRRESQAA